MSEIIRLKIKNGSNNSTLNLPSSSLINDLITEICKITGKENINELDVMNGYPPKSLDLFNNSTKKLSELNILNGDCLMVKSTPNKSASKEHNEVPNKKAKVDDKTNFADLYQEQCNSDTELLSKLTIPADNSCLFASIYCCMNNGAIEDYDSSEDRQTIARKVLNDPITYNQAFLDNKTPQEYSEWILDKNHWGGAIEISLLTKVYDVEIDVVNAQYVRIDRFGEDTNYSHRILILYDGIHYDALAVVDFNTGDVKYKFPVEDKTILTKALDLAKETKTSRQFTDVNNFKIKCYECDQMFVGQDAVTKHAKSSGHVKFGEL